VGYTCPPIRDGTDRIGDQELFFTVNQLLVPLLTECQHGSKSTHFFDLPDFPDFPISRAMLPYSSNAFFPARFLQLAAGVDGCFGIRGRKGRFAGSSSLSDLKEIGCKSIWLVYISPLFRPIERLLAFKIVKIHPCPVTFSLRFFKSDGLLVPQL